ncbi:MAG TPA: EF-P lysine aminoacylase EpmA [Pseudomonadales bacterium]|nr:EF-P lysine aminoacylase EpmA [Pseudomonadales bacterium]
MPRAGGVWRPGATLATLQRRAQILATIRTFFAARGVLEVDTPQLSPVTATDPLLASVPAQPGADDTPWFLHTSPEFAMKRLLAAGSGPIYQVARVFRRGERGKRHNPEFSMLEWYRPGFDTTRLAAEVAELVVAVIGERPVRRTAWSVLFRAALGMDPFIATDAELRACAATSAGEAVADWTRDELLDLLFSEHVEPQLGAGCLHFVDAFPAARASLARVITDADGNRVADRFELFIDGHEIANGYNELLDAQELRARMQADNTQRLVRGLDAVPLDERLLAAMEHGLPPCAGVALGLDRLVMIDVGVRDIDEVLAFSAHRA